jgi:hypothetical protein
VVIGVKWMVIGRLITESDWRVKWLKDERGSMKISKLSSVQDDGRRLVMF